MHAADSAAEARAMSKNRALPSAILNLSEGNGRSSPRDRARFFDISLGSIEETTAIFDTMAAFRLIPMKENLELQTELRLAYAMIINLKKSGFRISI